MSPRRQWLLALLAAPLGQRSALAAVDPAANAERPDDDAISPTRRLTFPRDHAAHLGSALEWWYATGWLADASAGAAPPAANLNAASLVGFQVTFFRSRTGMATDLPGRLAPRQLLFAHAAVTLLGAQPSHRHAQRIARWNGDPARAAVHAALTDTDIALAGWSLRREATRTGSSYAARLAAPEAGFALDLRLDATQPPLLQGEAGYSRKGPNVRQSVGQSVAQSAPQASHYLSEPQLAAAGSLLIDGHRRPLQGRAWLDHEWSNALMAPDAVGWDWIGINLSDGGALTAFVLRRQDGSVLWAGGSQRAGSPGALPRNFAPTEVSFTPGRVWTSPATGARYPVQWRIATPLGRFSLQALFDAQELDSRASTGGVYWEGLAELLDNAGHRAGLGYLEMTGRAAPLRLGSAATPAQNPAR